MLLVCSLSSSQTSDPNTGGDQQRSGNAVGKYLETWVARGTQRPSREFSVHDQNHKLHDDRADAQHKNLKRHVLVCVDELRQDGGEEQQSLRVCSLQHETITKNARAGANVRAFLGE